MVEKQDMEKLEKEGEGREEAKEKDMENDANTPQDRAWKKTYEEHILLSPDFPNVDSLGQS